MQGLEKFENIAKEILKRCAVEDDPQSIQNWLISQVSQTQPENKKALMSWEESFDFTDSMLMEFERLAQVPDDEKKVLSWPWKSWQKVIDNLEPGMLVSITAPDGTGKTIIGESLAEHWAKHKNNVVFDHFELNRKLMMMRRVARHASIDVRTLKSGRLNAEQSNQILEMKPRLMSWEGKISYLHTPGWNIDQTVAELHRLYQEGLCDVVVLDYLEKIAASSRQLKLYGSNIYQREADNVEQLKIFAESTGIPVIMIAQMKKDSKGKSIDNLDRTGMRGAGEKSDRANLVVMAKRERVPEGYSKELDVLVDKNTMGGTGTFKQIMQPQYFRITDIAEELDKMVAKRNGKMKELPTYFVNGSD